MKHLDSDSRRRLEALCWTRIETETRDACMILVALYTGTRASELLALTWADIDFDRRLVQIKTLKDGEDRAVPISVKLADALKRMRDVATQDRVFPISYPRLVQIWNEWRPVRIKFHALRHTFGLATYQSSRDIVFTQKLMGHKSLSSTSIYLRKQYSLAETRRMMRVK
jgi:integrase